MTGYITEEKPSEDTELKYINIEGYKIFIYDIDYLERIKGLYGFIYVTTNLINGKMYVGQKRVNKKDAHWKIYLGSGTILKKAIEKYGKENFDRKIIDIAFNQYELNSFEYYYTKVFDSVNKNNWYNLHYGGEVGIRTHYNLSEEGRQKQLANHPWKGKHHSDETKKKMSEAAKKREAKKKENNYQVSEETRKKLSACNKGRIGKNRKKVNQYNMDGKFIKTWDFSVDASKDLQIDLCSLRLAAVGKNKSAGGYQWRYWNEKDKENDIEPYQKAKRKDKGVKKSNKVPVKRMSMEELSNYRRKIHSIKINQYTIDDEYIRTYDSAIQAHLLDNHNVGSIRKCCKHNMKTHHGYKWFNADDPDQPDKSKIVH